MLAFAVVIYRTYDSTEVEIALHPGDTLVTRHPAGTTVAEALRKALPIVQYREDREFKSLLNQSEKGTA